MTHIKKLATKETWKASVKVPKSKDWTEVVAKTAVDIGAATAGGIGGSFAGKAAVPIGIALSALGNATGHRWLTSLGIGMIASPFDPFKAGKTTDTGFNLKNEFEAGKVRGKDYIEMLKEKFFINKILGKNQSTEQTDTSDTSTDTPSVNGLDSGIPKATLDRLTDFDQQILSDGIEYQANRETSSDGGVNGMEVELDELPHII
jgi:hypothetical protein